jgi:hypothetical protein
MNLFPNICFVIISSCVGLKPLAVVRGVYSVGGVHLCTVQRNWEYVQVVCSNW